MRNADHDLKICNAATPGPWEYDGMHSEILTPGRDDYWLIISQCRSAPDQEYPTDQFGHKYDANFAFIALAREALPYWIKRAQELEKALDDACKMLAENTGSCPWDMLDQYMDCGDSCDDDTALCWQKYFLRTKTVKQSR